jgi:hypothetical protein
MKVARRWSGRDLGPRKLETRLPVAHLDDIKPIAAMMQALVLAESKRET